MYSCFYNFSIIKKNNLIYISYFIQLIYNHKFHPPYPIFNNYPEAKPTFHSDRGFQYTSKVFKKKLEQAEMVQSMPRVERCIDNGPIEGFWGILKSEMYHRHNFSDYESLKSAVEEYIDYYNSNRYQKRLKCMAPLEYRHYLSTLVA